MDDGTRLSTYLRARSTATGAPGLVELSQPEHAERVLLFAHPVGGSLLAFQPLVRRFPDYRCVGLEASLKVLVDGEPAPTMQELARRYVAGLGDRYSDIARRAVARVIAKGSRAIRRPGSRRGRSPR